MKGMTKTFPGAAKPVLAKMITLEAGKITAESLGEVQEMIDICDFAVGLSRQLYGLTIASERPDHRMMEQWHPLGPVLVISAFNFPVAVWAWNAALALVCGNPVIWKPSEKTPLCAEAVMQLVRRALRRFGDAPEGLIQLVQGERDTQVPPANAEKLESLAKARKKAAPVKVVTIPGINHLLVPANTGEVDEYGRLTDRHVSPAVTTALINWLRETFALR